MPFIRSKVTRIVQPYDTWEHIRRWLTNRGSVADIEVRATPDDDWQDAARHPETVGLLTPDVTYTEQPVPASLPDAADAYPSATPDPPSSEHAVESPDKPAIGAQKTATSSTTVAGRTYSLSAIGAQQTAASATAADVTVHTGPWGTNTHHTGDVFRDAFTSGSGHGPEMVVLPSGSFTMGSPESEAGRHSNEGPQRSVRIGYQLAVGKYEVTFAEWDACVADGGGRDHQPSDAGWGRANRPVINVSWEDAQAYVAWLNQKTGLTGRTDRYRLLSEAEWEYAARAGTTTPFYTGSTISTRQANYKDDHNYGTGVKGEYREKTEPVGSFPPNAFGLHDMHGNVWEWVEDCYEAGYSVQPSDGSAFKNGSCSTRVSRGGSWNRTRHDLRSALRGRVTPGFRGSILGFRLARTLPALSSEPELKEPAARTEPLPWPAPKTNNRDLVSAAVLAMVFTLGIVAAVNALPGFLARVASAPGGETAQALSPAALERAVTSRRSQDSFRDPLSGGGEGPEMVVIPAGSFTMGSPESETGRDSDEGPRRRVRIGYDFAVGKYELTVDEYRSFTSQTGRSSSGGCWIWEGGGWKDMPSASWQSPGFSQAGNHPVTCVSWEDAQAYITWLNQKTGLTGRSDRYRLLSEAEWEYAARAGTTGRFSNNGGEAELCQIANGADGSTDYSWWNTACSDGYGKQAAPVGSFTRNGFGLHDLHGNVWEWVEDCYESNYSVQPSDGSAFTGNSCFYRVNRGGSWNYTPQNLRAANRDADRPGYRYGSLGFRLARTIRP